MWKIHMHECSRWMCVQGNLTLKELDLTLTTHTVDAQTCNFLCMGMDKTLTIACIDFCLELHKDFVHRKPFLFDGLKISCMGMQQSCTRVHGLSDGVQNYIVVNRNVHSSIHFHVQLDFTLSTSAHYNICFVSAFFTSCPFSYDLSHILNKISYFYLVLLSLKHLKV